MHGTQSDKKKCLEPVRSLRPGWGPDGGPMVTLAWEPLPGNPYVICAKNSKPKYEVGAHI